MTATTSSEAPVLETIRRVIDQAGASTVFGTPISQDGMIVLPAAKVSGGGGGGSGGRGGSDTGGGLGLSSRALGVFVIKDGKVAWRPAIDVNRVILGGQVVAVVALLTVRAVVKARRRRRET